MRLNQRLPHDELVQLGQLRSVSKEVIKLLDRAHQRLGPDKVGALLELVGAAFQLIPNHVRVEGDVVRNTELRPMEHRHNLLHRITKGRFAGHVRIGQAGDFCNLRRQRLFRIKQPHVLCLDLPVEHNERSQLNDLWLVFHVHNGRLEQTSGFGIEDDRLMHRGSHLDSAAR